MSITFDRFMSEGAKAGRGGSTRSYRRRVITSASVALAMTAPGQTAGISVFVDPLITSLHVSRSSVATAYLIGSLAGAVAMPLLGKGLDRFGPRRVMAVIGCCFGSILLAAGTATEIVGLTAAFVGIRIGGQGALSLVATTTVAVYVQQRKGFATGVVSAIGTSAISLAPLVLERLIGELGWRTAWQLEGCAVLALTVPAALLVLPRRVRAEEDATASLSTVEAGPALATADWTLRRVSRTAVFWVVISGAGVCSLVTTALTFHQVSLLGERGLDVAEAAANFIPQLIAGLFASFLVGWLSDHISDRALTIAIMAILALTTISAAWVRPGWAAIGYGLALGACTGGVRTLKAVVFIDRFGPHHLGALRGVVHSVIIGASALGPLVLALGRTWFDSYQCALAVLCSLPLLVIAAACTTRPPARRHHA
ncbi:MULTISPECIES: MFS transporter [Saccharopolyspora]|uniref:Cyanate permease n=1 Tax=Saccharopolyspora flava TaxID=95161 RepID=A0A1I6UTL9_9PSEU|nr:MFS transporter [Saccharopolyspora flava]SFT04808.1 Cyanate permease [Saccharopolyspora flava]